MFVDVPAKVETFPATQCLRSTEIPVKLCLSQIGACKKRWLGVQSAGISMVTIQESII